MLSSHLVADLERVCDHLVMLVDSHVELTGDVDELLAQHHRLIGPRHAAKLPSQAEVIQASHTERQSTFLVRSSAPIFDPAWTVEEVGLEDVVLAYMARGAGHKPSQHAGLVGLA